MLYGTEFTNEFKEYLFKNNIKIECNDIKDVEAIHKLTIFEKIKNDFIKETIKKSNEELDPTYLVYKKIRFGDVKAKKYYNDKNEFKKITKYNIVKKRLNINKKLAGLDYIPENLRKEIVDKYKEDKPKITMNEMSILRNFCIENNAPSVIDFINNLVRN